MRKWLESLYWWYRERTTLRLGKTDKEWDAYLQALALVFEFERDDASIFNNIMKLGPTHIWVMNFPAAAFQKPMGPSVGDVLCTTSRNTLPSLRTQYMLRDKLKRELGYEIK